MHVDGELLKALRCEIERYTRAKIAETTAKDYRFSWSVFKNWCAAMQRESFPATDETLALFVVSLLLEGRKVTTVKAYVFGVAYQHTSQGAPSPLTAKVRDVIAGATQLSEDRPHQMQPITLAMLRQMADKLREL